MSLTDLIDNPAELLDGTDELEQIDPIDRVADALARHGLSAQWLESEIETEELFEAI